MELSPTMQKYVLHWGEMGTRWGVNRTVAQIHALLFLAKQPLTAEDISETLGVATDAPSQFPMAEISFAALATVPSEME